MGYAICDEVTANRQAQAVNDYWYALGGIANARAEEVCERIRGRTMTYWAIRSDMVGGLPVEWFTVACVPGRRPEAIYPRRILQTKHYTLHHSADRHGPVDATRGAGRVMSHDLSVSALTKSA